MFKEWGDLTSKSGKESSNKWDLGTEKKLAVIGTVVGTASVVLASVVVPLLYVYVQNVHATLDYEVNFCKNNLYGLLEQLEKVAVFIRFILLLAIIHGCTFGEMNR